MQAMVTAAEKTSNAGSPHSTPGVFPGTFTIHAFNILQHFHLQNRKYAIPT